MTSRVPDDSRYWWPETGWGKQVTVATAFGIAVVALSLAAVILSPAGTDVAAWWPAAGVAVAVLARARSRRFFTALLLTLCLASFTGNLLSGRDVLLSLVFGVANGLEALLVVYWLRRGRRTPPSLTTFEGLGRLIVGTGIGASVLATIAGSTVALLLGGDYWLTWRQAAASHAAAILVIAPIGLALPEVRRHEWGLEVLGQWTVATVAVLAVFAPGQDLPLAFTITPVLAWAAIRFDLRVVLAQMVVVGVATSMLTSAGRGPFAAAGAEGAAPEITGALMQVFLVSCAMVTLPLAVAVAQRQAALREVSESEAMLRGVLQAATGTAIIATDTTGTITVFNPGAELLLGYGVHEIVGVHSPAVFHDPAEMEARAVELGIAPGFEVFVSELDQERDSVTRDWTYVRKDRTRRTVSLTVSQVLDERGALSGYLGLAEDVTQQRRAEAAIRSALDKERQAVERLEELDRAKTGFVSAVSHELRTPMTSVLGYAEMLADEEGIEALSPTQLDLVNRVQRNGQRLMGLIDDLLILSRVEAGEFTLRPVRLDLRDVVLGARDSVETMVADGLRDLTCAVPDVPVLLVGDREHLERAVANLLTNAIKFTPAGGEIRVRLTVDDQEAQVRVSDDGIGIPLSEQDRLFTRFFRASTATERAIQGSGLGLSLVRTIVTAHFGEVGLTSSPGHGTQVTITLPLVTGLTPRETPLARVGR